MQADIQYHLNKICTLFRVHCSALLESSMAATRAQVNQSTLVAVAQRRRPPLPPPQQASSTAF